MLADGGAAIADLAVLREQPNCSGRWPRRLPAAWRCSMVALGIAEAARGPRSGPGDRLGAARRDTRSVSAVHGGRPGDTRAGARYRRHDRDLPLREAGRDPDLEKDVRVSPAAVLPGQHERGAFGDPAPGTGRVEYRRRPRHRARPGPDADPRPLAPRHPDPDPHGHRRVHQGIPRAHQGPARERASMPASRSAPRSNRSVLRSRALPAEVWYPAIDFGSAATVPRSPTCPAYSPVRTSQRAPGSSCAASARTPAPNSTCSTPSKDGATS